MTPSRRARHELAVANRILVRQGILDEDGHISLRHPGNPSRYLLARALSPAFVEPDDILEFTLDGEPVADDAGALCSERFVHGAVLEARPDIQAVLFARSEDLLPFGVTQSALRPVIASVGDMGTHVPVWDIADKFGNGTDLSVSTLERGRDLARRLKSDRILLLRGMGFVATGRSLNDVVRMSVYLPRNARALAAAMPFGKIVGLTAGEASARLAIDPESSAMRRGWDYWARQAGCAHWLTD
ncbi:MAG TPA: class II aldolase/adducin family protein [Xanthobacteraceae bacterium]|jgi:HCOMODA/2-hydroxy-3-carboxy-muconic semialdehyde decarboxylase